MDIFFPRNAVVRRAQWSVTKPQPMHGMGFALPPRNLYVTG
jgi:hypothetical protein